MPIQSIFISYSRDDLTRAEELERLLQQQGLRVWRDLDANRGGDNWPARIGEAIMEHDAVLLCWSASTRDSYWVTVEWSIALAQRKLVVPFMLDWTPLHPSLSWLNAIDSPRMLLRTLENEDVDEQGGDNSVMELLSSARDADPQHIIELLRPLLAQITPRQPKDLTDTVPRVKQDHIKGRVRDLKDIHTWLFKEEHRVLINGLGGIGKTTLAQVYVDTYYEEYNHIAWISQLSDDFRADVVNTAGLLRRLGIQSEGKDIQTLFGEVLAEMDRIEGAPCLIVVDNATSALLPYYNQLPRQPNWHVLVTSREQLDEVEAFETLELGFLSETEAVDLFQSHYTRGKITEEEIKEILTYVDYHTLTIEILARTAQERRLKADALLNALKDDTRTGAVRTLHKGERIERVTSYLCSIFSLSALNEDETWLLKQLACLPPDFHRYDLIEALIHPDAHEKEDVLGETMSALVRKGWILEDRDLDQFKMHRIVSAVVKSELPIEMATLLPLINELTSRLNINQGKDNPVDKFVWAPFGKHVLESMPEDFVGDVTKLQNNLALVLWYQGDYPRTKELLARTVQFNEQHFGLDHPNTVRSYMNLATVLNDLGDYEEARSLLEKSIRIIENLLGPNHPTAAIAYSTLASLHQNLGQYTEAITLHEKALKADEHNFGPDHISTIRRYSNLATVLVELGKYNEALVQMKKVALFYEQTLGDGHPDTITSYMNLGTTLWKVGKPEEAKSLLEKAIEAIEKLLGPDHPQVAIYYSNLGLVLKDLGDFESAKTFLEKAVVISETHFGSLHLTTIENYAGLASLHQAMGNVTETIHLQRKVVQGDEAILGLTNPTTARNYKHLGELLLSVGEFQEAREAFEKCVHYYEEVVGREHPDTMYLYSDLGHVLQSTGDYEEAAMYQEKIVAYAEVHLGKDHVETAATYARLAETLRFIGELGGALDYSHKALEIYERALPEGHSEIAYMRAVCKLIEEDM